MIVAILLSFISEFYSRYVSFCHIRIVLLQHEMTITIFIKV